jgi:hypothetical protein
MSLFKRRHNDLTDSNFDDSCDRSALEPGN